MSAPQVAAFCALVPVTVLTTPPSARLVSSPGSAPMLSGEPPSGITNSSGSPEWRLSSTCSGVPAAESSE